MLSSVLATFDETNQPYVKTVMNELKQDENLNVRGIVFGRLFEKLTASIIVPEIEVEAVFEKLLVNGIHIHPFNEEYKKRIEKAHTKIKSKPEYIKDRVRTFYKNNSNSRYHDDHRNSDSSSTDSTNSVVKGQEKSHPKKTEIKPNFEFLLKKESATNFTIIDELCEEGDYVAIGNIVKRNPVMNSYAKEKYIPAIKNCININLEKGLENLAFVDPAIERLKEIIDNKDIGAITSEDLISAASNALLKVCSEQDPTKLIFLANLANAGQKLNVMSFIKLSELIFPNESHSETDKQLLRQVVDKLNTRYILVCYDVMETVISEVNKEHFKKLFDAISEIKQGTSELM